MRTIDFFPMVSLRQRPLDTMGRYFDQLLYPSRYNDVSVGWLPPADIAEAPNHYTVTMEIPGIDMNALDISYKDHVLTIRGEKKVDIGDDESACCTERYSGAFVRRFDIAEPVNEDRIEANYEDGILRVQLPKDENKKARKITVH